MRAEPSAADEALLIEKLKSNPSDWETRKLLARLYYDQGEFLRASKVVWSAEEVPSVDLELAFAARVLAKATPRKAIRLLSALLEQNRGKAVQNLGLANALLHHGMVLQAARFYGAALEADPALGNPDLEHFMVWTDDEETLWGDFRDRRPQLGELPWMKRDPEEALKLTARISQHTTPIRLATLPPAKGEDLGNELYEQKAAKGAKPTPPPAVTIPMDRVDPKDRRFDEELGAPAPPEFAGEPAESEAEPAPRPMLTPAQAPPPAAPAARPTPAPAPITPPSTIRPVGRAAAGPTPPAKPLQLPPKRTIQPAGTDEAPASPPAPKQLRFANPLPSAKPDAGDKEEG